VKDQSLPGQNVASTPSLLCDLLGIEGDRRELAQALFEAMFALLTARNRNERAKAVQKVNEINTAIKAEFEAMENSSSKLSLTSERLVSLLRSSGLSQEDLANIIGVSQPNISEWIKGTRPIPQKHAEKVYKTCIASVSNRFFELRASILGSSQERQNAA
jgi:DNA-binding transcriptional regulator YiaG